MFSYYGGKGALAKFYPEPIYEEIIEPFAGSGKYSLQHFERKVTLIDKSPVIIGVWNYLQQCSIRDILRIPIYPKGHVIKEADFTCIEEFHLVGFCISQGAFMPNRKVSEWGAIRMQNNINNIVRSLHKIRHWNFVCGDYNELGGGYLEEKRTWFVDPPYQKAGHKYPFGSKKIDYSALSLFCKSLRGQVIVCEEPSADWLPFDPFMKNKGLKSTSKEGIYYRVTD